MRAIVIDRPNAVVLKDIETPAPGPGEVRVRSVVAGVCRTDLDILTGALDLRWVRFPVVPGERRGGVVDALGEGVDGLSAGQRVVCEGNIGCMSCPRCRAGDTHLCQSYDAVGFTRGGGWGEFVVVPARILHPLPDHVSFEAAALVEPGSCVVKGLGRAHVEPAETVGVVGVGAMGALAIRLVRLARPPRSSPTGCATRSWSSLAHLGQTRSSTWRSRTPKRRRTALPGAASTSSSRRRARWLQCAALDPSRA